MRKPSPEKENGILKQFARYASLNVLGMIMLSCYILVDTFFISKGMGTAGLAALNFAIPMYSLIHGIGLMTGIGGATGYSIACGRGENPGESRVFSNTLLIGAGFSACLITMGILCSREISSLLGASGEVLEMTDTYMKTIMIFSPAFILNQIILGFVRSDGNPALSMAGMSAGSIFNIVMDYVFIFPLNMGIFGAVLATSLAPIVSLTVLSAHFLGKRNNFRLRGLSPQGKLVKGIFALGVSSFITEMSSGMVIAFFNVIILGLAGNTGVAAYSVIANIAFVVTSMYTGLAQGIQPLLGRAYGAGEKKTLVKLRGYALKTAAAVSVIIYAGIFAFAEPIANIFNSEHDADLEAIAVFGMRIYFAAGLMIGFNIVMSFFFTSTEKPLPAQIISLARGLLLIIPMALILSKLLGMTGVWLSFPVTEGIVSIGIIVYEKISHRRKKDEKIYS